MPFKVVKFFDKESTRALTFGPVADCWIDVHNGEILVDLGGKNIYVLARVVPSQDGLSNPAVWEILRGRLGSEVENEHGGEKYRYVTIDLGSHWNVVPNDHRE